VLSGWQDEKIRLFATETGQQIWQIDNAHKGGVSAICLSDNMKFFCSGGMEGDVRVWEMRSRTMVSHLKEHTGKVTMVKLIGDEMHLLSSSKDRALLGWDLKLEKRVSAHIQRIGGINCFDVVPGTCTVIASGQDKKITYWNLNQVEPQKIILTCNDARQQDECFSLQISKSGKHFITGGSQNIVKIWDTEAGSLLSEGRGHSGQINSLSFSSDEKQIVSGGKDGNVLLWNVYYD